MLGGLAKPRQLGVVCPVVELRRVTAAFGRVMQVRLQDRVGIVLPKPDVRDIENYDAKLTAIAEHYLNTQPSIGGVDVWWSALYGNEPGSDAAQLFQKARYSAAYYRSGYAIELRH